MNESQTRRCLNCNAELHGEFCSSCGQRDVDPRISVRDFASDLLAEHIGLDTRAGRTAATLLRKPGLLTLEFFAGRRVRYIPPLRLYLLLSVLFFLLSSLSSRLDTSSHGLTGGNGIVQIDTIGSRHTTRDSLQKQRRHVSLVNGSDNLDTLHGNALMLFMKKRAARKIGKLNANDTQTSLELVREFDEAMPDAMFVLVPALALLLTLTYFRQHRYYAEHLVFSLHLQSFVFLSLIVKLFVFPVIGFVAGFAGKKTAGAAYEAAMLCLTVWGLVYAFLALRKTYGESRIETGVKLVLLTGGYLLALVGVMTLMTGIIFLFG